MLRETGFLTPEGRWILPLAPSIAWLAGIGISQWWNQSKTINLVSVALLTSFALIAAPSLANDLYPRAEASRLTDKGQDSSQPYLVAYLLPDDDNTSRINNSDGDQETGSGSEPAILQLRDIDCRPEKHTALRFDDRLDCRLQWQLTGRAARNHRIAIKLLGGPAGDILLAEQISHPGQGLNPLRDWTPGRIYQDQIWLRAMSDHVEENISEVFGSGPSLIRVGLWVLDEGEDLGNDESSSTESNSDSDLSSDSFSGDSSSLAPRSSLRNLEAIDSSGQAIQWPIVADVPFQVAEEIVTPADARLDVRPQFGKHIELGGLRIDSEDESAIEFYWHVEPESRSAPTEIRDWTVFAHLLDASGDIIGQVDGIPMAGRSPTSIWQAGDVIRDRRKLDPAIEMDQLSSIRIGFYDPETGERLMLWDEGRATDLDAFEIDIP